MITHNIQGRSTFLFTEKATNVTTFFSWQKVVLLTPIASAAVPPTLTCSSCHVARMASSKRREGPVGL